MEFSHLVIADERKPVRAQIALVAVIVIPFLAVSVVIPVVWNRGANWSIYALAVGLYITNMLGITVGFHRFFTHRSFRANRALKIALAVTGSMAVEGPLLQWSADHRRHHAFAEREGDPHSPWKYGNTSMALIKGMLFAHIGWMFDSAETNQQMFVPDLLRDADVKAVSKYFGGFAILSLAIPPLIELAVGGSVWLIFQAFLWGSLVRVFMVHHVSWSVNSICHVIGSRPLPTRDRSTNFWPLAILSMGESWHNFHHAMPACARHGVLKGQIDISARVIYIFELLGWVTAVKWPGEFRERGPAAGPAAASTNPTV